MKFKIIILFCFICCFSAQGQQIYKDKPFIQDFAIKYAADEKLMDMAIDRNGKIQLLSESGLQQLSHAELLWPGEVLPDQVYRFMKDKNIVAIAQLDQQFVYLDKEVIFSNAWAGRLYTPHGLEEAKGFTCYPEFEFLIYADQALKYIKDSKSMWQITLANESIVQVLKARDPGKFYVLTTNNLYEGALNQRKLKKLFASSNMKSVAELTNEIVIAHEHLGLMFMNEKNQIVKVIDKLPSLNFTCLATINQALWVGTSEGAFKITADEKINYYASKRWLPSDKVVAIQQGIGTEVLVLTDKGLSKIRFEEYSLAKKAAFFEQQVRDRHIRLGFNANLVGMEDGNIRTGYLADSDNDGLWTSMYLASQAFRYAVTKSDEALQNMQESLDAMERLFSINPLQGFPSRSFERTGHIAELGDPERWQKAPAKDFDWKATTSSDEAIGHIFAYGVIAEVVEVPEVKKQAIKLIDSIMTHIVDHDLYLIDYDGKPTLWGKWNPEYVNSFSKNIGDRKLNSSNIIAMLQTAYQFTKKEKFKVKALELMEKHGYLDNLMTPMEQIGKATSDSDDLSQLLSMYWNHSDDEMYFLGYWGLYRYALTPELQTKFKASIIDHWEMEKPEKDALWNIITAITRTEEYGLEDGIWFLQEYPMDLIQWTIKNSHRKDIKLLSQNFRRQTTGQVLPPDELKIARHNGNRFVLDGGHDGTSENAAGDIWLLPYWMGRYLHIIQ
ncbi:hypothetical protein ACFRAE_05940 [Sphingobacterium sp. HJSM2_6]|uniref:hypothetical protein n=1 Tax=Sphingobacterium sp. HJSM2_6 TaxID=3366264 RepID=UPI003BD0D1EA